MEGKKERDLDGSGNNSGVFRVVPRRKRLLDENWYCEQFFGNIKHHYQMIFLTIDDNEEKARSAHNTLIVRKRESLFLGPLVSHSPQRVSIRSRLADHIVSMERIGKWLWEEERNESPISLYFSFTSLFLQVLRISREPCQSKATESNGDTSQNLRSNWKRNTVGLW